MSLADKVIMQQHRQSNGGSGVGNNTPDGYHIDDLGYWVEDDLVEDKARYAKYLLFRIRKLHPNIYTRYGILYCGHTMLTGTRGEILKLVDLPNAVVSAAQAAWIYNRLMETSPEIDESKIILGPGMYWDFKKAEICSLYDLPSIIRIKDINVRKRF